MAKMIEMPEVGEGQYRTKIYLTPTRVQAIEVTPDKVRLVMNTRGLEYSFVGDNRAPALAALISAGLLPGVTAPNAGIQNHIDLSK